jgi:hypothetical protein
MSCGPVGGMEPRGWAKLSLGLSASAHVQVTANTTLNHILIGLAIAH